MSKKLGSLAITLFLGLCLPALAATVSLKPAQSYPVGTDPTSVAVGDFNGDGKPDVAVVNMGSNNVSILLGKGGGTFRTGLNFDAGSTPSTLYTADFNGDGKLDVAVMVGPIANSPGEVRILMGNGDGTLQAPIVTTLTAQEFVAAVADVNGDKKADLVVNLFDANANPAGIEVLLGNGDGTFQTPKTAVPDPESVLIVADFNNDGKPDLAASNSNTVQIILGQGDGTFSQGGQAVLTDGFTASRAWTADVNSDGNVDLIVDSRSVHNGAEYSTDQRVSVFLGSGNGNFAGEQLVTTGSEGGGEFGITGDTLVTDLDTGDFNGDGILDIANRANAYARFRKTSNQPFSVNIGDGTGEFVSVSLADPGPLGFAADLNGDQLTDLIVLDSANDSIKVLLNSTPAFAMTAAAKNLTVTAGEQVMDKLSFTPVNGFTSAIQLSCQVTGQAPAPTCSLSPADIPAGANSPTSTLTISVPTSSGGLLTPISRWRLQPLYALGLPFAFLGFRLRLKRAKTPCQRCVTGILLVTAALLYTACGGGNSSMQSIQQAQSYTVQVKAASGTITKTSQISVTVQ